MTEAFKCDFCGEYKDGDPEEKLYRKEHIHGQGTDMVHVADACEQCWDELPDDQWSDKYE